MVKQLPSPAAISSPAKLPDQRWQIAEAQPELLDYLVQATNLSPLLAQVLLNRGIQTADQARVFLQPETQFLSSPLEDFPDLPLSLELLINAINQRQAIAICGDYDADGMTSTALLLRALRFLGARVDYAIPSRMSEGYGINRRIIEEFSEEGVGLILTVDNGISALDPIAYARELGLSVIITDHHDLPPVLPPANAILNPKLIQNPDSPYRGLAGVGVAYVLAVSLAQSLGKAEDLGQTLLELFTLGTIADLAPLTGVNRRWVRQGLQRLAKSQLTGVQALIQVAGLSGAKDLKPEAIGFRLGPRINAVGRLADPQIVIELLTTDDMGIALERAMQCEQINQQRQQLCEQIEQAAIALCENDPASIRESRVLVLAAPGWHHGVIGIVASRLVERYGVPVFIATYEDETHLRGSARGIPEFDVFEALQFCQEVLEKFGGHKAAGGFSLAADNLPELRSRLRQFAHQYLQAEHLKPLVKIDSAASLSQVTHSLYGQIDALHPCGIANPEPVFWSANVQVVEQRQIGKGHIKLGLRQVDDSGQSHQLAAIAWRWGEYYPLPKQVDIAYRLRLNEWNGDATVELELVGVRLPDSGQEVLPVKLLASFSYRERPYTCYFQPGSDDKILTIQNAEGKTLTVQQGQKMATLSAVATATPVDLSQPYYYHLVKAALQSLKDLSPQ